MAGTGVTKVVNRCEEAKENGKLGKLRSEKRQMSAINYLFLYPTSEVQVYKIKATIQYC
jgi:hypothetical protein